jgi:hypothetical protein
MFVFSFGILFAQEENPETHEEENDPAIESDWSVFEAPSYTRGDQMFGIGLGLNFPVLFRSNGKTIDNNFKLGGTGILSYDYFFTSHMAAGIEVNFSFNSTIGENMLYLVPIALRFTYQFNFNLFGQPFEVPLTMGVGFAPQKYLNEDYLGLYLKPSVGTFWRYNSDWSFGLTGNWWFLPQWTKPKSETTYGNFVTLTISARYHF